jgi:formate--tetrahydrofolate ligase
MKSDLDIAQEATLQPVENIASKLNIPKDALINYGPFIAKVDPIN